MSQGLQVCEFILLGNTRQPLPTSDMIEASFSSFRFDFLVRCSVVMDPWLKKAEKNPDVSHPPPCL